ncbi:MAG: ABC transporter ATP-binding protein [Thermoplasmata archaeon]|nr:MAG: ABC transporter ATP-binding protein [Thermoplasmata archaeon]
MANIAIKDLMRVYKTGKSEVIALRGLNLNVKDGEIIAIMGPSGCGKTTLLNLIGGLDRPTAGSIVVDGQNIINFPDSELVRYRREDVGFVFQFFNLVPTLTAYENIELPMRLAAKPSAERKKRVTELLELVDMKERAVHMPDELSGGEQQRVALATALANDPKVILADEPTGELDTKTGREVLQLFKTLRDKYNKTEIIVTHDLRISEFADRSLTIIDGLITGQQDEFERKRMKKYEEFQKALELPTDEVASSESKSH